MTPSDKLRELAAAAPLAAKANERIREYVGMAPDYDIVSDFATACDPATIAELVREVLAARAGNVPREPDDAMYEAAQTFSDTGRTYTREMWTRMFDAAPREPAKAEPVATLTPDYAALIGFYRRPQEKNLWRVGPNTAAETANAIESLLARANGFEARLDALAGLVRNRLPNAGIITANDAHDALIRALDAAEARVQELDRLHMTAEGRLDSVGIMLAGADKQIETLAASVAFHERNAIKAEAENAALRADAEQERRDAFRTIAAILLAGGPVKVSCINMIDSDRAIVSRTQAQNFDGEIYSAAIDAARAKNET